MPGVVRFGVSLEEGLLKRFDRHIQRHGYDNRSEAIRDLIRSALVRQEWEDSDEVVGALTFVYNHHVRELTERLNHLQHDHAGDIVSTLHVHLDHDNCLEILVIRSSPGRVRQLCDGIQSQRGVKHVTLAMTTSGKEIA